MSDNTSSPAPEVLPPARGHGRRRTAWIVVLVVAAGLTGAAATSAFSRGPGFGAGFGPGHWHGGMMGDPFDPAKAEERADRMVRHMAIEIDATDAQQDKLRAVVKAAVNDLIPMREKAQSARLKARELLTQPTIDRAEIERFRTEQLALADTFSKRASQALGDAAEILTPEQRRKLDNRLPFPGAGPGHGWNR
jgi:Spy/CpxP family protein refolding chaperone